MNTKEYLTNGQKTLEYIAQYHSTLRDRPVLHDVEPGYLRKLLPSEAPVKKEPFEAVLADLDKYIMPGVTHWQSPNFFAYYPGNTSYPSMLGDMITGAINAIGFSWVSSPAITELEVIVMDWLGRMLDLPESFLSVDKEGRITGGGGVIQGTASEATMFTLLAARHRAIAQLKAKSPDQEDHFFLGKLVAYTSDQAHFSVGKDCFVAMVKLRSIESDECGRMRGPALQKAIKEDIAKGLHPTFICATLGTTSTCAFDNLEEIGPIAQEVGAWLHIDAAYAGSAFVCPEYRHWMRGIEYADSFNFNLHKNFATVFNCAALWVKSQKDYVKPFNHEAATYMPSDQLCPELVTDYRHFQVALGRGFQSMKLWCVLRCYGVEGLQEMIRERCQQADRFAAYIRESSDFELPESSPPHLGLVCFRIKGSDARNKQLLDSLNNTRKVFLVSTTFRGQLLLRMAIGSIFGDQEAVDSAWSLIMECASKLAPDSEHAT